MRIGVPKEIKNHEYRVGLVPAGVRELAHRGMRSSSRPMPATVSVSTTPTMAPAPESSRLRKRYSRPPT